MTTSAQLQREADVARAGLSSTLDELRLSMTRTALTSGATALAKESSATLMRAVVRRASDHPLAALLIGAGVLMMFSRANGDSFGGGLIERTTGAVKRAVHGVSGESAEVMHEARDKAASIKQSVSDTTAEAQQKVRETTDQIQQKARETTDQIQQKAGEVTEKARRLTTESMDRAATQVNRLVQEQPILLAALAVAAGAVLGAALPVTDAERRHLGPAASRATARGREVADRVTGAVSGKAEEAVAVAGDTIASEVLGDAHRPG
jgi:ElaB/YqjD/DUF883 family membrane-anchored ribosome-binding protein